MGSVFDKLIGCLTPRKETLMKLSKYKDLRRVINLNKRPVVCREGLNKQNIQIHTDVHNGHTIHYVHHMLYWR